MQLSLPPDVEAVAADYLAQFADEHPESLGRVMAAGFAPSFIRTLATSDYFAQTVLRRPDIIDALIEGSPGPLTHELTGTVGPVSVDGQNLDAMLASLRAYRHQQMARILWRTNGGLCSVESTLTDLSSLANGLVREAVSASHQQVSALYGEPGGDSGPDQLCVLAMGKLGGGELNMSSDIDVIMTHSESGETDGRRRVSNTEFFTRQTKVFSDLLARLTPDGFCYRVDTRLRPFGKSGQPCVNLAALEHYLAVHGREWERYAYIKQRALSGSPSQQADVTRLLKPFVYRKYLDYGVFKELRSMKSLIDDEVRLRELQNNIKRGPGGIRELEFIVQTMQIVFGGKYPVLQTPSFFTALNRLSELNYLPADAARSIHDDYCFLRRIENGVQGFRDQQTHDLPSSVLDQQRLSVLMGLDSTDQLLEQLAAVRERVQSQFDELSVMASDDQSPDLTSTQTFRKVSENEALASLNTLKTLRERLETTGRERLDALMPRVVERLSEADDAEELAPRLTRLLSGIGRRSAYFSLLLENPAVLDRVITICRNSPDLASQLSVSPVLLDTLVDPRGSSVALDRQGLAARLDAQLDGADSDDEERQLIALREFRKASMFDVAVADMEHQLPLMKISDRLTDIAELVLERALEMAKAQLQDRHGTPRRDDGNGEPAQFVIIGYGKLGGIELGYGSDLDLVFLFDDGGEGCTDGEKSVDNAQYFSKLSRRLIQILTVPTRAGTLYEIDMRLRPSGRSGLLVSRLGAYETYQREQAWTWEHQALIRARAVAGDPGLRADYEELRRALLQQPREHKKLAHDVAYMRGKMKAGLNRSTETTFDLKQGDGGLVDLEFLVQFLVLAHSSDVPSLAAFSDNVRQLEAIEAAGLLEEVTAGSLRSAYVALRGKMHEHALAGKSVLVDQGEFVEERALIYGQLEKHALAPAPADPDIL